MDFSRMKRFLVLFQVLLLCFLVADLSAQGKKGKKKGVDEMFDDAEYFFEQKNYLRALPIYKELLQGDPGNVVFQYRLGICFLFKADEKEQAITLLEEVRKVNPEIEKLNFYLGRAYHLNNRFDEAIGYFNKYGEEKLPAQEKNIVNQYISYCQNGKVLTQTPIEIEIKNLGGPINTENSEYVPVITADETMLLFTYKGVNSKGGLQDLKFKPDPNGEYYEDIMVSHRVGDTWLSPESISDKINTNAHDASIALSNDGQLLFIYKSSPKDKGDIYQSRLRGDVWTEPVKLKGDVNTPGAWEGSCSITNDGKTLYFASERPGGFGGRDIYVSELQPDSTWGKAKNLGPTINTPFNDDAPFIHPDGITLFISSEGHNSIGGYDIFYTVNREDGWGKPVNLGYPANTAFDERFYVLSADGATGYFSSDRKGTVGQQDIYAVSPGFQGEPPILALVVGFITVDKKPADATITVTNDENGQPQGVYKTNTSTGKYMIALKPGNKYKVAIEVEGLDTYYEYINVKGLDTYVQVNKDYDFTTPVDGGKPRPMVADSSEVLQNKIDEQLRKIREEQKTDVYENKIYKNLLKKFGDFTKDSVLYQVEIGRFENPADFDSTKLDGLGPYRRETRDDGSTIYIAGPFKSLLDAEVYRAKLPARDSTAAKNSTVTVIDRGERKMVQQYYKKEYTRKDYQPPKDTRLIKSKKGTLNTTIGSDVGYDKLVKDYGTFEAEGLSYKLELATVEKEGDFDPTPFEKYGKVEKKVYPDGKVRYSLGPFNTLKEAEEFKKMLVEKEAEAAKSIVTVFFFGQRKSVPEFFNELPCDNKPVDLTWFMNKSLNDPEVYRKFLELSGNYCKEGLIYKVQIGAYRHPENFKYPQVAEYLPAEILPYPDGITRFTLKQFKTIREAEVFRQQVIKKGITDAWITAVYKGERKTLEDLIRANFYGATIN
ncbi:MAG: ompA [Bacteroidetes bacterium]|nr:MAG: ompA [Bacteroidota bacterium]